MQQLTILFDADDVCENLLDCWLAILNRDYGTALTRDDITEWDVTKFFPSISKQQIFAPLFGEEIWNLLEPIQDAPNYLRLLYNEGHHLYMVTATDYRTCEKKLNRILEIFPFLPKENIIISHHKQLILGDILIDDAPHNLVGGCYRPILFTQPHNKNFPAEQFGMTRVSTWEEIYALVHSIAKEESDEK